MTRATTTTLNINNFKVSAYAQDAYGTYHTLMDQVTVRRTGQNSWTYSPKVNWPGVPVDFFAVSPASVKVDNNAWSNHTINYTRSAPATETCLLRCECARNRSPARSS